MPKRRYTKKYTRKRRVYKRKKTVPARAGKKMQTSALSFTKERYMKVTPIQLDIGESVSTVCVSGFAGKNTTTPAGTITLPEIDPDGKLASDMRLHQQFRVTGWAVKLFFPPGTTPAATPV